ncbi:DivIVA domain-containing protein [Motilibacter rhizosphaerae]|uniref:Cell wall synthesis protein Wag31 n=1 Tax=Motilibacter rhizosphaerae TaxID=598652 RepID=A0A4Q7NH60_9ACTN|nr:DivIVA domain-containing protein [Motilibacter rhizosphaerae]RZS82786.1 DivIVA domain-containing protein [Motilibacter rhizosphaerae]
MTTTDPEAGGFRTGRITPSDVRNVLFSRAGIGRHGYDEIEVDIFLERVEHELFRLVGEKGELRDEADRLRRRLAGSDGDGGGAEASAQAVRVLSAAQQTADQYVAEAELYAKRLSVETRVACERMIDEARARAQQILDDAERIAGDAGGTAEGAGARVLGGQQAPAALPPGSGATSAAARQELEQQVAYLQAFGRACRTQLRAYLEALLHDVEDEWGRAHPEVLGSMAARTPGGGPVGSALLPVGDPLAGAPAGDGGRTIELDGEPHARTGR